jgi:hypothetical protein
MLGQSHLTWHNKVTLAGNMKRGTFGKSTPPGKLSYTTIIEKLNNIPFTSYH